MATFLLKRYTVHVPEYSCRVTVCVPVTGPSHVATIAAPRGPCLSMTSQGEAVTLHT